MRDKIVRSERSSMSWWLTTGVGTRLIKIENCEANLDAGRFAIFSKSVCEYAVLIEGSFLMVGKSLHVAIDWLGEHARSNWCLEIWAEDNRSGGFWKNRFTFANRADAVLFKLTFDQIGAQKA